MNEDPRRWPALRRLTARPHAPACGPRHSGRAAVRRLRRAVALVLLAADPPAVWAHTGHPPAPHDLWAAWSLEPWVIVPLAAAAAMYTIGARRLAGRAREAHRRRPWRFYSFGAGLFLTAVALISPLDALGSSLFAAHMTQHEILIVLAAPLLVLGAPLVPMLWALPIGMRRRLGLWANRVVRRPWRLLTQPGVAFALHAMALVAWHLPSLYQATLSSDAIHAVQHVSFAGTAILFWWSLVGSGPGRRVRYGAAVLCLFGTALLGSVLGALLTFAEVPWYPAYAQTAPLWGLTPLEDQQLGGLIMWIPAGVVHLPVALAFVAFWAGLYGSTARASRPGDPRLATQARA